MPQKQTPTTPTPENIDPELIRQLEAYVRSERRGPRIAGLHTSEMVSATVLKLLVKGDTSGKSLEYQDFRKLAYKVAHDVVVDAIRAISRGKRRTKPLHLVPELEAAPSEQPPLEPQVRDALIRAVQSLKPPDYCLLIMCLRGAGWEQVAASLEITEEAARKRWQRLLEKFTREMLDG